MSFLSFDATDGQILASVYAKYSFFFTPYYTANSTNVVTFVWLTISHNDNCIVYRVYRNDSLMRREEEKTTRQEKKQGLYSRLSIFFCRLFLYAFLCKKTAITKAHLACIVTMKWIDLKINAFICQNVSRIIWPNKSNLIISCFDALWTDK